MVHRNFMKDETEVTIGEVKYNLHKQLCSYILHCTLGV